MKHSPITTLLLAVPLALPLATTAWGAPQGSPFESPDPVAPRGHIDELVFARLAQLEIAPARLSSDAVFVRRVFLDLLGTLPTPAETRAFLTDKEPNKRALLVDRLLEREEFAAYWAMKWGDLLRVKAEFPINLWPNAVQAYHRWIRTSIAENEPYDIFVRRMLTASGSCFRVPEVNFWRAVQGTEPETLAGAVALTFMGCRIQGWSTEERANLAVFFSELGHKGTAEWKEEILFHDPRLRTPAGPRAAVFPDGTQVMLPPDVDPREVFADWLLAPDHPLFARAIVNRIWCWLQGRGIVHEPDDFGDHNPPVNPELLDWLAQELIAADYDLKHVYRLILTSATYQLSSIPQSTDPAAEANFAFYPLRRLEAEVLIDALCRLTGTTEEYTSAIPEPFTFVPDDQRSIELSDGSITSPFLEMFGRPPRDTGLASERNNQPTATQRLHLLNSTHIQKKIEGSPALRNALRSEKNPRRLTVRVYMLILSRNPTRDELDAVMSYLESGVVARREGIIDLAWALINSTEFLYRH